MADTMSLHLICARGLDVCSMFEVGGVLLRLLLDMYLTLL
jgi:hypothetical protein